MRTLVTLLLATALTASALVIPKSSGTWPDSWPKEFEALRERSRTTEWATGSQEDSHRIPFTDRAEFEKFWPLFAKMLKPGARINLVAPAKEATAVEDRTAAGVIVHTSPAGTGKASTPKGDGIETGPPWPKSAYLPDGSLPEYVVLEHVDGKDTWVPLTKDKKLRGFQYRARTDITLICDGKIIDPEQIAVPEGVVLNDAR